MLMIHQDQEYDADGAGARPKRNAKNVAAWCSAAGELNRPTVEPLLWSVTSRARAAAKASALLGVLERSLVQAALALSCCGGQQGVALVSSLRPTPTQRLMHLTSPVLLSTTRRSRNSRCRAPHQTRSRRRQHKLLTLGHLRPRSFGHFALRFIYN